MNAPTYGLPQDRTTQRSITVALAPSWATVARALLDGATCACGQLALRLTLNVVPSAKDAPKHGSNLHRYGPLPKDWTVNATTWCGSTDEDHTNANDVALTEDDL